MHVGGNPSTIVGDRDASITFDRDRDFGAITGQRLIDRVVDDLVYEMVKSIRTRGPDVHRRSFSNWLESFQDLDRTGVVTHGPSFWRSPCRELVPTILERLEGERGVPLEGLTYGRKCVPGVVEGYRNPEGRAKLNVSIFVSGWRPPAREQEFSPRCGIPAGGGGSRSNIVHATRPFCALFRYAWASRRRESFHRPAAKVVTAITHPERRSEPLSIEPHRSRRANILR